MGVVAIDTDSEFDHTTEWWDGPKIHDCFRATVPSFNSTMPVIRKSLDGPRPFYTPSDDYWDGDDPIEPPSSGTECSPPKAREARAPAPAATPTPTPTPAPVPAPAPAPAAVRKSLSATQLPPVEHDELDSTRVASSDVQSDVEFASAHLDDIFDARSVVTPSPPSEHPSSPTRRGSLRQARSLGSLPPASIRPLLRPSLRSLQASSPGRKRRMSPPATSSPSSLSRVSRSTPFSTARRRRPRPSAMTWCSFSASCVEVVRSWALQRRLEGKPGNWEIAADLAAEQLDL